MNGFKILPHTSDIRFKIWADSPEELFRQGLNACSLIAGDKTKTDTSVEIISKIEIESLDITSLLIDFLSDVVSLMDTQKVFISSLDIVELSETKLTALIKYESVESFDKSIKAVTYHEANVKINESGEYSTIVVLDI
jgi:SHS2 domain-containing protein